MLPKESKKWQAFATNCATLNEKDRIIKVEQAGLNKINRGIILDDVYASFFSPTMLYFPSEVLKRVLSEKFEEVFPEFKNDPDTIDHAKWTLRIEVIGKFCQLSEILAAHLLASEKTGNNFKSYEGYASKLIEYNVGDAVNFYSRIKSITDPELVTIMGYPKLEKQKAKEKTWLERSLFELGIDLELIGDEYAKFKDLYNAYKHGCRMLHPKTATMDGEAAGLIMFLTQKSAITKGGEVKMFEFPNDDFTSFFNLIQRIILILNVMLTNRRERYYLANNVQEDCSLAIYFSPSITEPDEVEKGLEFTLG